MASVKICGLNSPQAVHAVVYAKADYAGFVYFPKSPRHIELQKAAALKALLPTTIQCVCVLVAPDNGLLADVAKILNPAYVQLHGDETPQRVREIKNAFPHIKIIKAIKVQSGDDITKAGHYYDCADMLMFDAKPPEMCALPGGNGLSFDWALLRRRVFPLPWMLSGGLNADNVGHAIQQTGATIVDVSSGVESAPGVKDATLIEAFIKETRSV